MGSYYFRLVFIDLPALAARLSVGLISGAFNYLNLLHYLVLGRGKPGLKRKFDFVYKARQFSFSLFGGSPEVAALIETFVYKEYDLPGLRDPKVIVDVGAHTGNTTWYFHLSFPEATIYAIEASQKNFVRLLENTKPCSRVVAVHAALTNGETDKVTFYETASSLGSSTLQRGQNDVAIEVKAVGLNELFAQYKIARADVIKLDIEGGEEQVFQGINPADFSDRYIIEVHEDLMSMSGEEFKAQFSDFDCVQRDIGQSGRYMLDCTLRR